MSEVDGMAALTKGPASEEAGRGREAEAPHEIPPKGLKDVLFRVVAEEIELFSEKVIENPLGDARCVRERFAEHTTTHGFRQRLPALP